MPCRDYVRRVLIRRSKEKEKHSSVDSKLIYIKPHLDLVAFLWLSDSFDGKPADTMLAGIEYGCFVAFLEWGPAIWHQNPLCAYVSSANRRIQLEKADQQTRVWMVSFRIGKRGEISDRNYDDCGFDMTIARTAGRDVVKAEWSAKERNLDCVLSIYSERE